MYAFFLYIATYVYSTAQKNKLKEPIVGHTTVNTEGKYSFTTENREIPH